MVLYLKLLISYGFVDFLRLISHSKMCNTLSEYYVFVLQNENVFLFSVPTGFASGTPDKDLTCSGGFCV